MNEKKRLNWKFNTNYNASTHGMHRYICATILQKAMYYSFIKKNHEMKTTQRGREVNYHLVKV
jgi:hypothetical protein